MSLLLTFNRFHVFVSIAGSEQANVYRGALSCVNIVTKCLKLNPLIANFTKWSNTLKQFVGQLPTNCLSVFDHSVGLALKGLKRLSNETFLELKSVMGVEVMGKSQESFVLRP